MAIHTIHGLTVRSPLDLSPVPTDSQRSEPVNADVEVRLGGGRDIGPHEEGVTVQRGGERIYLRRQDIGLFRLLAGDSILVEPAPSVSSRTLRWYLLAAAMPLLLVQRGVLPLHASAVDIDGAAVVFAGGSGAGKSTLAAALGSRGHPILCNDVGAVHPDDGPTVSPGIPAVKLDPATAEVFGPTLCRQDWTPVELEKSYYTVDDDPPGGADRLAGRPIRAIYLLSVGEAAESEPAVRVERLSAAEATVGLVGAAYPATIMAESGLSRELLEGCTAVAGTGPIYRLTRSADADLTSLPACCEAVTGGAPTPRVTRADG